MTAQRQVHRRGHEIALIVLAALFVAASGGRAAVAATTERIVVNRFSGLAIDGYDPVGYFTDHAAVMGLPEFEARQGGELVIA